VIKLANNKAAGPDNIGPRLLEETASVILELLLHITHLFLLPVWCQVY